MYIYMYIDIYMLSNNQQVAGVRLRFASDETGITRTAARRLRVPPRLQRRLATTPYSVCGEAHKTAKPHVDTALDEAGCGTAFHDISCRFFFEYLCFI